MIKYLCVIALFFISCASTKKLEGTYKSNFADLGFFITEIEFKKDSTFSYIFAGDMIHQNLSGIYKIKSGNVYLQFDSEKFGDFNVDDTTSFAEYFSGKYHNYDIKQEQNIIYHLKYKIVNNKLFIYRVDNGSLVKSGRYCSDSRRYGLFGKRCWIKKRYLERI